MRQGVRLDPLLEAISKFLDSQHEMIERVRRDLVRGLKKPRKGRRGLTAPQVLRSLVVMRVKNWDYRELRERIADGVTLRQFTDFYCDPVPKHDAFNRGFNRLTPQTLKAINEMVVQAAVALGLEDGAKLRVDTTVVETDIHHPTDNTLLWDVVRVVTRLVGRLAKALKMRRIKVRAPLEFGHKVFLAESAKGLIAQYEVLKGNPADEVHVAPSLKRHRRAFRRAPELYGADRGFFSEHNVTACVQGAVKTVCIPQRGGSKTPQRQAYERSAAFKQGQRFRAGIEGRISGLMRGRGTKRCRAEGAERFALFVAAAVLANNLMILAALLTKRSSRRSKAAR